MNQIKNIFHLLITMIILSSAGCYYVDRADSSDTNITGSTTSSTDDSSTDPGINIADQIIDVSIETVSPTPVTETIMTSDEISASKENIRIIAENIPDPENAFFTDTGRLFFTGGPALYELTAENGAVRLLNDNYGLYAGIAQHGKWLYVIHAGINTAMTAVDFSEIISRSGIHSLVQNINNNIIEKGVYRADLTATAENMVFKKIFTLKNMFLCNGMAADSDGNLYITDNTMLPAGQIVKLTVRNEESAVPDVTQEIWLSSKTGSYSPNGIVIIKNSLYFTDFLVTSSKQARVKKVPIVNGKAGTPEIIYSTAGLFDDLDIGIYRNSAVIAVADYPGNSIILINEKDRSVVKLASGRLSSPSSVHFGRGPLFKPGELVVTEKGLLYDYYSAIGNRLSCLTLPE